MIPSLASIILPLFAVTATATPTRVGHSRGISRALPALPSKKGATCTVKPVGQGKDDTPGILKAFQDCNNGGTVIFLEGENYNIATKLNPVLNDITIEWKGTWTLSDNLNYWRNNSYPIAFQNHHAGFVVSGDRISINGYGTGGINGNGNAWYNVDEGNTQPGRPMPFVFWNVSDVTVEHFSVVDSPLWAINIMNGTNMAFDDMYVNSTALKAPYGSNWVQNTDGFDTMDARNIMLTNMVYQGGDDCIAIKPRSYNIFAQNITCHGGNGIAIGSLGQYLEDSTVENVVVQDVNILTYNADMHNSAYIKTWVGALVPQSGYESAGLPRGGGWGIVRNILFANFFIDGAAAGPGINQDNGNNGSFSGSSLMEISNVVYENFTGSLSAKSGNKTASVSCSLVHPCFNIAMRNVSLAPTASAASEDEATGSCAYTLGGIYGMQGSGCYGALVRF